MNKNTLRLFLSGALLGALLSPTTLFALGLGELHLNSALNQPFDADIDIASATQDELNSLHVTIANDDTFRQAGLDRPEVLSSFKFSLGTSAGHAVIKVRSDRAVSEPFINLLVDVSWTGGRVLRQYTVLLDPPVFANTPTTDQSSMVTPHGETQESNPASGTIERTPAAAPSETSETPKTPPAPTEAPVTSPEPSAAVPMPTPAPSATPIEEPAATQPAPQEAAAPTNYQSADSYTVRPADTLSKIAAKLRTRGVTTRQLMVALYRANAPAFGGDMNVLRSGAVLRIPPAADVEAIAPSAASAEVSRQYGLWRNSHAAAQAATETQGDRLRLVPAQQTQPAQSASASSASAKAAAEKAAKEQAARKAAEEAEAKRLLELKNAELAKMQKQLSASSAAKQQPTASSVSASAASAPEETMQATPPEEATPATEPAPQAEAAKPAKPAAPPAASPGLLDALQNYWMQILGAGLILILLLVFYFRRKRHSEAELDSTVATMTAQDFDEQLRGGGRPQGRGFADTHADLTPQVEAAFERDDFEEPAPVAAPTTRREPAAHTLSDDTLSSETALHLEQQDALAEADFHMAYGLYDQAADIVKLAIERQPDRRDLMLKLAEIYFVWGNRDMFLDAARRLHDTRKQAAPGEWDKVVIMGKQICPDDPLFSGDRARSGSGDNIDVNLEGGEHRVDVDLYDAPTGEQAKPSMDFELERSGSYAGNRGDSGLDFLLDEPQRGVGNDTTREMDPNARTQETPTIESPYLSDLPDSGSQTIREQFDVNSFGGADRAHDQTSEIALDEIGLHVDHLESTGSVDTTGSVQTIGDDEATRIARREALEPTVETPHFGGTKTMLAPHMEEFSMDGLDGGAPEEKSSNTITVEQIDLNEISGLIDMTDADTSNSGMFKPTQKIDVNMGKFDIHAEDTIEQLRPDLTGSGVYRATQKIDMDFAGLDNNDMEATKQLGRPDDFDQLEDTGKTQINKTMTEVRPTPTYAPTEAMESSLELPEMEPVTMSEVGTKLDLARAYMDMGDPDGARSILKEVMDEGNPGQKQEAQRLLESIG